VSIIFTQYLMPHGRATRTEIDMPAEIEAMANKFVRSGGWYESEMLSDYQTISLTACHKIDGESQDVVTKLCKNSPDVVAAVEYVVRESVKWMDKSA